MAADGPPLCSFAPRQTCYMQVILSYDRGRDGADPSAGDQYMTSVDLRVPEAADDGGVRLDAAPIGYRATIAMISPEDVEDDGGVPPEELERRLLEMGFVEGAQLEVLHMGLFGGDPIAVRLNDTRIALRKREARAIALTAASA
ncbi:MAG: FeoA family protein [Caulobacterales bacterium]